MDTAKRVITTLMGLFLALLIIFLLCGCECESATDEFSSSQGFDMSRVSYDKGGRVADFYYDIDTKVMYVRSNSGVYTLLVNPDGSPRIYEEDVEP